MDSKDSPPYQQNPPEVLAAPQYYGDGKDDLAYRPMSSGLESVWDDAGKEVVPPSQHLVIPSGSTAPDYQDQERPSEQKPSREYCGLSKKLFLLLVAAVIIIIIGIALGVGLGIGLTSKSSSGSATSDADYSIGGAIDPAYYSTTGAFNGSGIALASQSFSSNITAETQGSIVMYYQHYTGEIRWKELSSSGEWVGGTISETVTADARNSTPLSAVSYSSGGMNTWHIFYVGNDNMIKQKTNSNVTNVWVDGPINEARLRANDADQVGMQACWYGNDYGDSDYSHTQLPSSNGPDGNASNSNQVGMNIWYASDDTTFQWLGWRDGETSWQHQGNFTHMNGHAGVGCYSWGPGTVTYAMFVNSENQTNIFWRDTNTNLTSTAKHPINEWVKSSVSIPGVNPASSLGYTNYFYMQMDDNLINGYNISWAAEDTKIVSGSEFTVEGDPGISGTHLSVTALPNSGGGNNILVFYQVDGDDVTEYTRDIVAGQWTSSEVIAPGS